MIAAACTPCILGTLKVGATAFAGAIGYSKVRDRKFKKTKKKNKKTKSKTKKGGGKRYTKKQKEFIRVCRRVEKNKVLNPNMRNLDCESMLDQGSKEISWMKNWYEDALKNKKLDWNKYNKHYSKKKTRKKSNKRNKRNKTRRVRMKK
jgi:hypothetical protein